jgi:hypothetical protein
VRDPAAIRHCREVLVASQDVDRGRRVAAWPDLEIRQVGRAILIRVRTASFGDWWHADETWSGQPFRAVRDWLEEEGQPLG